MGDQPTLLLAHCINWVVMAWDGIKFPAKNYCTRPSLIPVCSKTAHALSELEVWCDLTQNAEPVSSPFLQIP